ncbi:polyketide cyclase [Sphingopyxis sp. Root214]|uniref:SRPBCC family protein n=1 Tax=unclassified Sphingopyxis TaxID=2614943 RepID=UPI0006F8579F|nr:MULTISPECIES: SRPBCC family protein [unclassified Sphingopyxis]KQZ71577.1 polyketide cyclase [Sphingopyxis sp. Root154]KRC05486.1 polyketide cyclase [Sphingopyxis sp. Root214]
MSFDTVAQAAMVVRKVEDVTHEGQPARAVIASRDYPTDIADLWNAITEKDRIPRWFAPVDGDLTLGGKYQIKGNAGGTVTACDPPRSFALTWEFSGGMSWVEVELAAASDDRTRLTLRHIAPLDDKSEEFWDRFGPGAVGVGWDLSLMGLGWHIETGESNERFAEETWALSDEGKAFATWSSEAWTAASIAYGTAEEAANRAGTNTTAFYTGAAAPE